MPQSMESVKLNLNEEYDRDIEAREKRIREAAQFLRGYIYGANGEVRALRELDTLLIECHEYVAVLKGKVLP